MRTGFVVVDKAPRYGVAAVSLSRCIQCSLCCFQRGSWVSGRCNLQRLLLIDSTQLIPECTVLAVELIGVKLLFFLGVSLLAHFIQTVGFLIILDKLLDFRNVAGHLHICRSCEFFSAKMQNSSNLRQLRAFENTNTADTGCYA